MKVTEAALGFKSGKKPLVEVVEAYPGQAMVIVGPTKRLREIDFLNLVEIAPARFLLVITTGTGVESLELAIGDLLENISPDEAYEVELLTELFKVMRHRRGSRTSRKLKFCCFEPVNS